ncbi:MAG: hypothetical protein QOF04_1578 [Solirubrobacteraceae bacterium]|jgi:predicted MFS family arabinose efflux permease|nr:hypothetical protein [Solirubrobacteraceae bacterium]
MVALALALALALVPESRDPHASGLDLPGAALSIAGLTALLHGRIEAPSRGWTDPLILGAFGASAVALGAFAAWEPRTATPTLDVRLFRNPRFSVASGAIALAFFGLFGVLFATSQYLQNVHGFAPFEAGLWSLPVAGGLAIGGPLGARLTAKPGTKLTVAGGLTALAGGLALYAQVTPPAGFALIGGAQVVLGLGIGLAMTPATDSIMGSLPAARASVGSAMDDTVRMVGGSLGVAVLGSLLSTHYRDPMDGAVHGLPAQASATAHESITGATAVAERVGGSAGRALHDVAGVAFVDAMQSVMLVAGAVCVAAALLALALLPAREHAIAGRPAPAGAAPPAEPVAA